MNKLAHLDIVDGRKIFLEENLEIYILKPYNVKTFWPISGNLSKKKKQRYIEVYHITKLFVVENWYNVKML